MTSHREEPYDEGSGGRYCRVQPERDPEANWEVDLAKKLEEYLLKICSGEISSVSGEDDGHIPVNFAEAALLLQGSVQVYSRKVEYLYSLVLHALEFIYQNSQHDQPDGTSAHPEESCSPAASDGENDRFWGLDDVPVDATNSLDSQTSKDAPLNNFVKPPANLLVLEGDCLDTNGDDGELESYLLATSDLYKDFILLDPCDAGAVLGFSIEDNGLKEQNRSNRKSYMSPTRRSAGTAHKSSCRKSYDANNNPSPRVDNCNMGLDPPARENTGCGCNMDDRYSEPQDFDDSDDGNDDPWKPLNPHEPGNLKVKPFRKVKASQNVVSYRKKPSITTLFPLARMHGTISPELTEMWEAQHRACESRRDSQSPPLFEKLRQSLVNGGQGTCDTYSDPEYDKEDNGFDDFPDFEQPNNDMPGNMYMDEDVPFHPEKHDDGTAHFDANEAYVSEEPNSHATLEDLCRSHLDALLASIAESEKQTDLSARVSTWKEKIEHNLEEQDSRPPFDIHQYGDRILDKLSLETDNRNVVSFTDVVKGQEKHDVARSFSALLQLVNNGDVDLDTGTTNEDSKCYTAVSPFNIRLLRRDKRREGILLRSSKKRAKSPLKEVCQKNDKVKLIDNASSSNIRSTKISSQSNCKFSVKLGKTSVIRCSPEGKRRRKSLYVEPVDLHSAG